MKYVFVSMAFMLVPSLAFAQSYRFAPPPPQNNVSATTPQRGYASPYSQQAYAMARSAIGTAATNGALRYGGQTAARYGYEDIGPIGEGFSGVGAVGFAVQGYFQNPAVAHAPGANPSQYRH